MKTGKSRTLKGNPEPSHSWWAASLLSALSVFTGVAFLLRAIKYRCKLKECTDGLDPQVEGIKKRFFSPDESFLSSWAFVVLENNDLTSFWLKTCYFFSILSVAVSTWYFDCHMNMQKHAAVSDVTNVIVRLEEILIFFLNVLMK